MRLRRLRLRNYGCFAELDLALATEPGRITLVTAPNGSGKSVLRQAFHDVLFDIPKQSPMKFRHGYPGMAIHAEALDGDGTSFEFGWVRNGKPERVTSDPARFAALRTQVGPQQLESLFLLDTTRLRQGGTDLKGGVSLSEALLAGTGELAPAKAVRALLGQRRDQNWGRRKSTPPLNQAAARLDATGKRVRAAVERPEARERQERELQDREDGLAGIRQELADAATELRMLNRVGLTRPHLEALRAAEEWLDANQDAPALPAGLDATLVDARAALALAQAGHLTATRTLALAGEAMGSIVRDPACTSLADRLGQLQGQLGEAEKARTDLGRLQAKHATTMAELRAILGTISSDLPVEQASKLIPTVALKAEVQAAINDEVALATKLTMAREGVTNAHSALCRAEGKPTVAASVPDGLQGLLMEIRADRNPVIHAEEVAATRTDAQAQVRRALALVPGWQGTAEGLRDLRLPPEAEFERLDMERSDARDRSQAASDKVDELTGEEQRTRAALAALRERPLPDTATVLAARAERDRGMRLLIARASGTAASQPEEASFAGGEPLALAYERRVRLADDLADRRADELERVQEAERLARRIADLAGPLRQATLDAGQATTRLTEADDQWSAAVRLLGLGAATRMGELRHALAARLKVIDALAAAEVATETENSLTGRHAAWAGRLSACLSVAPAPLASLLILADQRVSRAQEAERTAIKDQATLDRARQALQEASDGLEAAEARMEQWRPRWSALLVRLGRPGGESPAAVAAVLQALVTLEGHHREATSLAERIHGMQADLRRFAEDVATLAAEAGQPMAVTVPDTARALIDRFTAASAAEARWVQAREAVQGASNAADEAGRVLNDAQVQLDAVVASCGAPDADVAEARIAASRAHAGHVADRDAARQGLLEQGDGLPTATLLEEASSVAPDTVVARRQAAEELARSAQRRAEDARVEASNLQAVLDQSSSSTDALEAQADHQAAIATFDRLLEDQIVLQVASGMLDDAMREVEDGTGGSVLARIDGTFSSVTDGAYGLELHDGPAGEELHAVERSFPAERKGLEELSEGTRDQLYLALRMEALRDHCRSATPVPFIVDDVLQTFDDGRASAALRALCTLATDLQVVVLSHHPHVEALARALGDEAVKVVRLPGSSPHADPRVTVSA